MGRNLWEPTFLRRVYDMGAAEAGLVYLFITAVPGILGTFACGAIDRPPRPPRSPLVRLVPRIDLLPARPPEPRLLLLVARDARAGRPDRIRLLVRRLDAGPRLVARRDGDGPGPRPAERARGHRGDLEHDLELRRPGRRTLSRGRPQRATRGDVRRRGRALFPRDRRRDAVARHDQLSRARPAARSARHETEDSLRCAARSLFMASVMGSRQPGESTRRTRPRRPGKRRPGHDAGRRTTPPSSTRPTRPSCSGATPTSTPPSAWTPTRWAIRASARATPIASRRARS